MGGKGMTLEKLERATEVGQRIHSIRYHIRALKSISPDTKVSLETGKTTITLSEIFPEAASVVVERLEQILEEAEKEFEKL